MSVSRRKFIKKAALSTIGVVIIPTLYPDYLSLASPAGNIDPDMDLLLEQARQARLNGNYLLSENLYNQVLQIQPGEIRAYFGLRKTYLVQDKCLEVVQLFEQGVDSNPENIRLICQLAKEYTSVALGNKSVEEMLDYDESLLKMAHDLYALALSLGSPGETSYRGTGRMESSQSFSGTTGLDGDGENSESVAEVGLSKVETKIDQNAASTDARDNPKIKAEKKLNRVKFKNRFSEYGAVELQGKLNTLLAKPNPQTRSKHVKELYRLNIQKKKQAFDFTGAFSLAYALYQFDKKDTTSLHIAKRLALKTENYQQLVSICLDNDTLKNTFWSKLSYFDALMRYHRSGMGNTLTTLTTVLNAMQNNFSHDPNMRLEYMYRKIDLAFVKNNTVDMKAAILEMGTNIVGSSSVHNAVRFCRTLTGYYLKSGKKGLAVEIVNNIRDTGQYIDNPSQDEVLGLFNRFKETIYVEHKAHIREIDVLRDKIYQTII